MVTGKSARVERMRILIYSANFAPEPTGVGKYSGEMAAWLVSQGHEVRVIAAPPYYPGWKIAPGYRWPPFRRENFAGADVRRAPIWVPKSPGGTARALHLLSFALSSFPLMLMQLPWRPDVVLYGGSRIPVRSGGTARGVAHGGEVVAPSAGLRN